MDDPEKRKSLHLVMDDLSLGITDIERRKQRLKIFVLLTIYALYAIMAASILYELFYTKYIDTEIIFEKEHYFWVLFSYLVALLVIVIAKMLFYMYRFCIWGYKNLDPLNHNVVCRFKL